MEKEVLELIQSMKNEITTLKANFNDLNEKVDFLLHKEQVTEKDLFTIKRKLEVIK